MASSILLCFDLMGVWVGFACFLFLKKTNKPQTVKLRIPLPVFTRCYVALL